MKIWVHAPALRDRSVWDAISPFIEASILDVGCGRGKFGFYIEFAQMGMKDKGLKVGMDLYLPYLNFAKYHRLYDLLIRADITSLPFKHESFDCVVASDVIEHLSKEDGYKMIEDIENIACKRVVISSPSHFFHQEAHHGNILQKHLSEWSPLFFQKRGYKVEMISNITGRYKFYSDIVKNLLQLGKSYLREFTSVIRERGLGHMIYIKDIRSQSNSVKYQFPKDIIYELICPICKKQLSVYDFRSTGNEIEYGILFCEKCGRYYPIGSSLIGVPEVVPDEWRDFSKDFIFIHKYKEKIPKEVLKVVNAQQRRSDKNE